MRAGRLRHRIDLQQKQTTQDDYGSEVTIWYDVATVWAAIDPLSPTQMVGAKETFAAGAEIAQDMVRVTLRPREVGTDWRFLYKGRVYDIKAVRLNNSGDTLTLYATVGASNG